MTAAEAAAVAEVSYDRGEGVGEEVTPPVAAEAPPAAEAAPPQSAEGLGTVAGDDQAVDVYESVDAYDGLEVDEDGVSELGYVAFGLGDRIKLFSAASEGHSGNRFPEYAWGSPFPLPEIDCGGWVPVACLRSVL